MRTNPVLFLKTYHDKVLVVHKQILRMSLKDYKYEAEAMETGSFRRSSRVRISQKRN